MDYKDYSMLLLALFFGILVAVLFYFPQLTAYWRLGVVAAGVLFLAMIFLTFLNKLTEPSA